MKEFILENAKYVLWFIFSSGVFVEIVPTIKWNPISSILSWIGNKMNKDIKKDMALIQTDIKTIQKDVRSLNKDLQTHKVESWRRDILEFADFLMQGNKKTKENFDFIILTHDNYEKYIKENNIENGQVDIAYDYILEKFKEFRDVTGFLN